MQPEPSAPEDTFLITHNGDGQYSVLVVGWEKLKEKIIEGIMGEELYKDGIYHPSKYASIDVEEAKGYINNLEDEDFWTYIKLKEWNYESKKYQCCFSFEDGSVNVSRVTHMDGCRII